MILEGHQAGGSPGAIFSFYFVFLNSIYNLYRIFDLIFDCAMQHADWRTGECSSESPQKVPIWARSLLYYL